MKKKILVTTLSVMLVLGAVSCSDSLVEQAGDSGAFSVAELNTNPDDIRALDFYSAEPTEADYTADITENLNKVTEFTQLDAPVSGDVIAIIDTTKGVVKVKLLPEVAPKAVHNFVEHSLNDYYDGLSFHRVIDEFMVQSGDPKGNGAGGESIWGQPFVNEISTYARHFPGALAMANTNNNYSNGSQFYLVDNFTLPQSILDEFTMYTENQDVPIDSLYENEGLEAGDGEEGSPTEEDASNSPLVSTLFPQVIIDKYTELGGAPYLDFGYTVFGQTFEGMETIEAISQVETGENDKPTEDVLINDITIGIVK